ncbi:MAG: hypothetical protein QFB86_03080 [Patescibacteria group bacterium]|nr:hypothetical protein [Patescibacteria group bacterium]
MQMPNAPLIAWIILKVASLLTDGPLSKYISIAAAIVLAIWAVLELKSGVNYFRRILGAVVLLLTLISLTKII